MTTYIDKAKCPKGHTFSIRRRLTSIGFKVDTLCRKCDQSYLILAGPGPEFVPAAERKLLERDIEARLVQRVKALGGECRKVAWQGRVGAPDRVCFLPNKNGYDNLIWVELKAPGGAATFPKNAHEKAQHREHERMRKMGQRVEVVDSYERIEELLK